MTALAQVNTYLSNHYEGMTPEQLILLLFKGALDRIELTRQGVKENDIQKRGVNLSKTIAIISELNASLDPEMDDDSTRFLRGLYAAILAELPKVSLNNSTDILDRTEKYIIRLKEIWEQDVMPHGESVPGPKKENINQAKPRPLRQATGYGSPAGGKRFNGISV